MALGIIRWRVFVESKWFVFHSPSQNKKTITIITPNSVVCDCFLTTNLVYQNILDYAVLSNKHEIIFYVDNNAY